MYDEAGNPRPNAPKPNYGNQYQSNGYLNNGNNPVQNTADLRNDAKQNSADASGIMAGLDPNNYVPFGETGEAGTLKGRETSAGAAVAEVNAGNFSAQDQAKINAAEQETRAKYQPFVDSAKSAKESGLPKSVVNAGERGGFMNTQYAGVAALLPTQGGDFIGAGGLLSRIASDYDKNIASAQQQMESAVIQAREAAKTAIVTGKASDLKAAQDAYDRAQKAYNEGLTLKQKKAVDLAAAQDRANTLNDKAKETAAETVANLVKADIDLTTEEIASFAKTYNMAPEDFAKLYEVMKTEHKRNPDQVAQTDAQVNQLITADAVLTPEQVATFASAYGMSPENFSKMYESMKADYKVSHSAQLASVEVGKAKALADYLNTQPAGQPVKIGENTYFGTSGTGAVEVDATGYGKMLVVDQKTGEVKVKNIGFVGLPKDGWQYFVGNDGNAWSFNKNTGEWKPAIMPGTNSGSNVSADWTDILEDGSVYTGVDGRDPTGQCGVLVNDMTGLGVGDTLESKASKCDPTLGTDANPLQIGDVVVMRAGTTGHVAVINGISVSPDGKQHFTLTESNWKRNAQGQGIVDNTRTISEDDGSIVGFARGKLKPQFSSGPSAGNQINTGTKPTTPVTYSDISSAKKAIATDKRVADYMELAPKAQELDVALSHALAQGDDKSKAAADQVLIILFNKMLDPTSAVREGEYARTSEGQGLLARAQGMFDNLKQGGAAITDEARKDMVDVAYKLLGVSEQQYNQAVEENVPTLQKYSIDPKDAIPGYDSYTSGQTSTPPASASLYPPNTDVAGARAAGYKVKRLRDGNYAIWK